MKPHDPIAPAGWAPGTRLARKPAAGPRRGLRALALVGILALCVALRVPGSLTGLPARVFPDEANKVETARHLAENGFRHDLHQPGFLYDSLYAAFRVAAPLRSVAERAPLLRDRLAGEPDGSAYFSWIARCWMVSLATITTAAVFGIGRRVAGSLAGLLAAYLFAVDPLAIATSSYVKEDTPLAFFACFATLAALRLAASGRPRDALLAGAAAGAAFGAKYNGAFSLLPIGLACVLSETASPGGRPRRAFGLAAAVLTGFAAGFALACPAALRSPAEALEGMVFQLRYITSQHHDGIALPLWRTHGVFYLTRALLPAFGSLGLIAALAGALVLAARDRRAAAIVATSGLGYLVLMETMPTKPYPFFARYALPAVPPLCVLAGTFCAWAFDAASGRERPRRGLELALGLVALGVLAQPTSTALRFVASISPDTRDRAAAWMRQHLPEHSLVLATPYGPDLRNERFGVFPVLDPAAAREVSRTRGVAVYYLLSDLAYARFFENPEGSPQQLALFASIFEQATPVAVFTSDAPRFGFHNPELHLLLARGGAASAPAGRSTEATEAGGD